MLELTTMLSELSMFKGIVRQSKLTIEETESKIEECEPKLIDMFATFLKKCEDVEVNGFNYVKLEHNFYMLLLEDGVIRNIKEIPFLKFKQ